MVIKRRKKRLMCDFGISEECQTNLTVKSLSILVVALLVFDRCCSLANTASEKPGVSSDSVYVDRDPEFPGGDDALATFINENLITPPDDGGCGGTRYAKVVTRFLVEVDGSINEINIIDSAGPLYNQEAILLVQSLPQFKSGYKNGKPVKAYFNLPVVFGSQRKKTDAGY
jgi:hypothetical protein